MELRQLDAFVAVATELHFGRAAVRLHIGQPTLSDLVRRLEREVGATLLTRTSRRVSLTNAGAEMLERARLILDQAGAAVAAMHQWADGDVGIVRLGIAPPVAPVLAPHLVAALHADAPGVELQVRRMWPFDLERAIADDTIDVAITCGPVPAMTGVVSAVYCGEPWMVGLRTGHRLTGRDAVVLSDLGAETLGMHSEALFPAWTEAQKRALRVAGVRPTIVELADTDLSAWKWPAQSDVDWILTTASLAVSDLAATIRPVTPQQAVPFILHWAPGRATNPAVGRFVRLALDGDLPPGMVRRSNEPRRSQAS
ncbi:LysR family transcriptional regulator [Mycolicibacterium sp. J2]|uniref:LysR family transcriptional regulator n=1 Tax=Mycolicibacterium sp. J2 TaxID=2993511 RepID=UPI00224A8D0C|nr:LysR family transcriptional regulator [Mycolicibacterium sp. J2]MCX2713607.1 LysR family transcriptional regulator [Mycolicibacterium sp. J2]